MGRMIIKHFQTRKPQSQIQYSAKPEIKMETPQPKIAVETTVTETKPKAIKKETVKPTPKAIVEDVKTNETTPIDAEPKNETK